MQGPGREVIYCGDTIHHPLQVADSHYHMVDADPVQADLTRRRLIERCAGSGAILLPAHFLHPGTVRETHGRFSFQG
jgi:hypothetical protein